MRFNWTNLIFATGLIFIIALTVSSIIGARNEKATTDWVTNTYYTKYKLQQISTGLLQSNAFINPAIPLLTHALDSAVQDNSFQQKNVNRLGGYLMEGRALTGNNGNTQHLLSLRDSVEALTLMMQNEEDRLLIKKIIRQNADEKKAYTSIFLFAILTLGSIAFAFYRLRHETRMLNRSQVDNTSLETTIAGNVKEIALQNQQLITQNTELEQKNRELYSFTYITSHDLKEPVRKIETFAKKMTAEGEATLSDKNKNYLSRILVTAERMQSLLQSMLIYAQVEVNLEFSRTDLTTVVNEALDMHKEVIEEKEAIIQCKKLPVINAIPAQMLQLFTNLIENALKYARQNVQPVIHIAAEKTKAPANPKNVMWKITVADNGIGFSSDYKEKIFQIFQRLHAKNEYSGTGVGLAICRKIVENHHGTITADSNGSGAIFTFFLPENYKSDTKFV